jgi:hypothetical protein
MTSLPTPQDVQYGKIITTEVVHDSALTSFVVEVEQSLKTDPATVLQFIIEALGHINKRQTRKVEFVIIADENYNIERITKKYPAVVDKSGRAKS